MGVGRLDRARSRRRSARRSHGSSREDRKEVSSPVGIVQGSSEALNQGVQTYLWVLGAAQPSLALLNLLPLLPLDGGHIVFSIVEGIRGRAVGREVYERASAVGIALVCSCSSSGSRTTSASSVGSERSIRVGACQIGGGAPVAVQSMTLTPTHDVAATKRRSRRSPRPAARSCAARCRRSRTRRPWRRIVRLSPLPVIADIHFNASLALRAIDAGVAAVRINPGNIGGADKVATGRRGGQARGNPDADRRELRVAADDLDELAQCRPGRGARRGGAGGGRAARETRLPRLQDLRQVEPCTDDDPRVPAALLEGSVPATIWA